MPDWYVKQYWAEVEAENARFFDDFCDLCGEDHCICDRIAAEQNADYEREVY